MGLEFRGGRRGCVPVLGLSPAPSRLDLLPSVGFAIVSESKPDTPSSHDRVLLRPKGTRRCRRLPAALPSRSLFSSSSSPSPLINCNGHPPSTTSLAYCAFDLSSALS